MKIRVRTRGPVNVLDVTGSIIADEGEIRLRDKLSELLAAGEPLFMLNLSDLSDLDSGCLGELVACHEHVRRHDGVLKLIVSRRARDRFLAAGLDRLFELYRTEDEAFDSFEAETETAGIP